MNQLSIIYDQPNPIPETSLLTPLTPHISPYMFSLGPFHSKGLPSARLPIRKNGAIKSLHQTVNHRLAALLVQIGLRAILSEGVVESKRHSLLLVNLTCFF